MENPDLEKLQAETIEKEKTVLAIYSGLAAFSITCLLRLVTLPSNSVLVISASCLFTISAISFSLIALSKHHVLHQAKDIHIGHVIVSEDSAKLPQVIGGTSIIIGFLAMLLYISVSTFLVALVSLMLAAKHQNKFKSEMTKMMGAREVLKNKEKS